MKKHLIILFAIALFAQGCTIQYVEVYKTESTNTKRLNDFYVYEKKDTVEIDYRFWDENGVFQFRISNQSEKPMYIDWKKCAYLTKDSRYDYWSDKAATNISFRTSTEYDPSAFPGIPGFTSVGSINIKSTKRERVTFIPPKSYITVVLSPIIKEYLYIDKRNHDFEQHDEVSNYNPKEQTTIYSKRYSKDNSLISFRNFLTLSFKEDFSSEFYADNEFFVKEINEMDKRNFFQGRILDYQGNPIDTSKYKKGTDFYKIAQ